MIVQLLNVPKTEEEWQVWSWHHRLSHAAIRQAALSQKNVSLTDYELDPIPAADVVGWLERNEQTHIEMNGVVGAQASDLQTVNLQDESQKTAWIFLHFLEHQTAEQRLGVGS
jgi:hypothetical protein